MHDSIFERKINIFPTKKIFLMVGFMSSYVFIPFRFFFIGIMACSSPGKWGWIIFLPVLGLTVENLGGRRLFGGC